MAEKETKKEESTEEKEKEDHTIFIGNKPPMSYVLAIVTEFKKENTDAVTIKARGRAISRAVDAVEIARNRFVTDAVIKDIKIDTESVTNNEGETHNVSSIEIILKMNK
jgi:DNA-binding protein